MNCNCNSLQMQRIWKSIFSKHFNKQKFHTNAKILKKHLKQHKFITNFKTAVMHCKCKDFKTCGKILQPHKFIANAKILKNIFWNKIYYCTNSLQLQRFWKKSWEKIFKNHHCNFQDFEENTFFFNFKA